MTIAPIALIAQDFEIGLRGGFNLGNYQGEDNGGLHKFGGYGGIMLTYNINNNTNLQTEVNYSMQGFRDHVDGESLKVDLNYITIPILIQFKLRNFEQFKIIFGPQIGYLVRANEDPEDFYRPVYIGFRDFAIQEIYKDIDYGANLGLEYEINDQFCVQTRYYHGISKIYNKSVLDSDAKNRVFSLGLAYRL